MRGLAPKPSPKLTIDEWSNLEYEAIKRGDAGSTCAICHDPFGEDEQVILSCSHTFHRGCIASFEKFLRTKERTCPICRHASYQKKITSIGSFIKRQDSCTLIQKTIRRWRVKINFKTLLRAHYKSNDDTVNVGRKRDFYAGEISIVSDQIAAQVQASEDTIDSLFAEFDRNLTMSREVFNPELAAANAATRESNDLLRTKASSKDAKNENRIGLIKIKAWINILNRAEERGACECPICLSSYEENTSTDKAILSCSHTLHIKCVDAFEKFNIYEINLCPVCRALTSIGSFIKRQDSCTLIQKTIRRWRVKINFKTLLRAHYKSNDDTVNVGRKRDFYAGEISIVSDQIAAQVQASEDTIDSLFAEFDRNLTMSREVFNPELAAANAATRESNDLLRTKASSKDAKNENRIGLIKIKAWINILNRAEERGACECPICLSSYEENTSTDKAILSCSHTLHIKCVDAFEKFNIYEINLCPVCRAGPYQKKLVSDLQYYRANSENMNLNAI